MSERYFYDKFWKSVDELHDQIQLEQWPASLNEKKRIQSADWTMKQFQNFFVGIYVKYVYLTRRVEDSYDQIIHIQIRSMIRKFLENLLIRLVKIYGEICYYTNPILELKPLQYVFLDDYLFDLKLEPEAFEVVIPRYFREDNSEQMINRRIIFEEGLKRVHNGKALPEEDKTKFFFNLDINIDDALTMIQNFEIVRQNIKRINVKLKLESKKAEEQIGGGQALDINEKRKINLEHLIAVQKAKQIKENELKFLNMKPYTEKESAMIPALNSIGSNPTEKEEAFANIKNTTENRKDRKEIQKEKQRDFEEFNKDLESQIKAVEGYDMKQKMINERRDWMEKYKQDNRGVPPQTLNLYYDQFKVTIKKELDDNQRKEKDKIAKDKLKKEQDKKKKDEQGDKIRIAPYTGVKGEEIANIQNYIGEFKAQFETASEFINHKDDFLVNLSRNIALDKIKEIIRLEVDQMIAVEMANRRTIFLKGKKDKIKKPPKVKAVAEKFCTGEKPLAKVPLFDLFNELIEKGIIRKMVPKYLEDLICDFNYIGFRMNINDQKAIDIPLFYTKQLLKKYCIFPLGSPFLKSNLHNVASVLFHGPPGTGKTHAALAIAYHCDALFLDISPRNVEGKNSTKEENSRLLASTFRVAKNNQPAVIYFDNADQIYCNKKSKDATKNPMAQKMKKYIASMKNLITPNTRVLIIGCSNKGWVIPSKDQKSIFDKAFYFGLPSYSDRLKLWKLKVQEKTNQVDALDFSVLAEMSKGYSHESIISSINYTLSRQRLERVKFNPIKAEEFISPLSKTEYVYQEVYESQKNFLFSISGLKEKHDYLEKKRMENEKNSKKR